jgi:integrase
MGKRAKGEGTIYGPDKNGAWWAQLPKGADGKRPRRKAASEAEALLALRELHAERAAGRDPSRKAETVGELLDAYIETIEAQGRRGATLQSYRRSIEHIRGQIGAMKITAVTHETVQRTANSLARETGPTAVREALERLRAAYEAVVPDRVARNPVNIKKLRLRQHTPAERQPLEDTQVRAILAAGDDADERGRYVRYGVAWWLIGLLGVRRGEACGLSWRDVNWERAELKVRQQMAPDADGGFALGLIKTPAGVRVLPLGPRLLARLRLEWEASQAERKRHGWKEHGLIVAHEDGTPVRPDFLNHALTLLCTEEALPHVHPHLLRHTVATLISEEGFSEAVIAAVLGHSKGSNVTRRYTHATDKAKRSAVLAAEARILGSIKAAEEAR